MIWLRRHLFLLSEFKKIHFNVCIRKVGKHKANLIHRYENVPALGIIVAGIINLDSIFDIAT